MPKKRSQPRIAIDGMVTPTKRSGIGRYLENLLYALERRSVDNELFVFLGRNQKDLAAHTGKSIITIPSRISTEHRIINLFRLQMIVPVICWLYKIDVLHIPNEKCLLIKPCSLVFTIHDVGDYINRKRTNLLRFIFRRFSLPLSFRIADHIIAVSHKTKKDLIRFFHIDPDRISVIYEGVSPNLYDRPSVQFAKKILRNYSISHSYILFVGELARRKNIPFLVKAFSRYTEEYSSNMELVIVGKDAGAYKSIKREINKCNLREKVKVTGYINDDDLAALYHFAHCLVLPSMYEGFGLPVIEAMAKGIPVIVANSGSLPEIVGDAGLVVDCHDINSLKEALHRLGEDKELYGRLKVAGLIRSKQFTCEKFVDETYEIYMRVYRERKRKILGQS